MKIRNGFVSNSSTTSFCIYGIGINDENLRKSFKDLCEKKIITEKDFINIFGGCNNEYDFNSEELTKFFDNNDCNDISVYTDCDNSIIYIGRSPESLKDDETGKQFKDKTNNILSKILDRKVSVNWIQETVQS